MPSKKSKSLKASVSGQESTEPSALRAAASEDGGMTPPIQAERPELPDGEGPPPATTDEIQPPADNIAKPPAPENPGPSAPLPGKPAQVPVNHFHIPANPERLKLEAIQERQLVRRDQTRPAVITNDLIYDLLMDILDNQELLANKIVDKEKQALASLKTLTGGLQRVDR
ncbi:hypothetical protein [Paenibacillus xanthanilyticus]|uniref:Uncharacterized protein n=1 Tax=Paenibacillus xanthanilyticus TaxID=1783531 RepID=A0ABV8K6R6_9BACL